MVRDVFVFNLITWLFPVQLDFEDDELSTALHN